MRLERTVSADGRGHVYWVPAVDTESKDPVWMKVWDSSEIPIEAVAEAVAWELRHPDKVDASVERRYNMRVPRPQRGPK